MWKLRVLVGVLFCLLCSPAMAGEMAERQDIANEARYLLSNSFYAELDELSVEYRESEVRTSGGEWKLPQLYLGFEQLMDAGEKDAAHWRYFDSLTRDYLETRPQSPTAIIMRAKYFLTYAQNLRENDREGLVVRDTPDLFDEYVEKAYNLLLEGEAIAAIDPEWYVLHVEILDASDGDPNVLEDNLAKGAEAFPTYARLWYKTLDYYLLRSDNDAQLVESLADYALTFSYEIDGMAMYSRIHWHAALSEHASEIKFKESGVNWVLMKTGMNDVLENYTNEWNIQHPRYNIY